VLQASAKIIQTVTNSEYVSSLYPKDGENTSFNNHPYILKMNPGRPSESLMRMCENTRHTQKIAISSLSLSTVTLGHLGCGTPIYQNFFKKKR
jgi:hypothetical protein